MALEGGGKSLKRGCRAYFCAFSSLPVSERKREIPHTSKLVQAVFFLSVESGGENFNSDSCPKPERIHEYFAFVYIRQLGVAVIKLFKNLFLLVRKRCLEIVVMVCDVLHKLFCFGSQFATPPRSGKRFRTTILQVYFS